MSESKDGESTKIQKLDTVEEWSVWKFQVKVLLKANNWYTVVDGSYVKPVLNQFENAATFNKALEEFSRADCKAQKVIVQTIGTADTAYYELRLGS